MSLSLAGPGLDSAPGRSRSPSSPSAAKRANTRPTCGEAFATAGFDWVTSHAFRTTLATLMDHAGLSSRAAADQLGHANTSMTTDVYVGRKVTTSGAAAVLEALHTSVLLGVPEGNLCDRDTGSRSASTGATDDLGVLPGTVRGSRTCLPAGIAYGGCWV